MVTSFCNWNTYYNTVRSQLPQCIDWQTFYDKVCNTLGERNEPDDFENTIRVEREWYKQNRPYYKVWPSFVAMLSQLFLDIKVSTFLTTPESTVCIRFSKNQFLTDGIHKIQSILYRRMNCECCGNYLIVSQQYSRMNSIDTSCAGGLCIDFIKFKDFTFNDILHQLAPQADPVIPANDLPSSRLLKIGISCVLKILLLSQDPSIIQPDVLAKDRNRFDRSTDPEERQRLIDKAKRRGIVGWRLGEQYEVCPHFRRPHFGLRWTGEGRKVPRIVPIKGAVVHRQKITEVPTGYIMPDGREVE